MDYDNYDGGYIAIYRKIMDSRVWNNAELLKVWMYCLLTANWKDNWVTVNVGNHTTEVEVKRGQFIFGRLSASKKLKMKPISLYKRMQKLKSMQNINIDSNTHYSIITVCNYDDYQSQDLIGEQPEEQPRNSQGTAEEQPGNSRVTQLNKDNNVEEGLIRDNKDNNNTPICDSGESRDMFGEPIEPTKPKKDPDIIKTKEGLPDLSINEFVEYWNKSEMATTIQHMGPKRIKALKRACEDRFFVVNWKRLIDCAAENPFNVGKGPNKWVARVDWFLRQDKWYEIREEHDAKEDLEFNDDGY